MSEWIGVEDRMPDLYDGCTCEDCGGGPITWTDCVMVLDPTGMEVRATYDYEDGHWFLSQNGRSLGFIPKEWREYTPE